MAHPSYRLLPEWHPQDGLQLTWPRPDGDWQPILEQIEATLERIVLATADTQRVLISVPDAATRERLATRFATFGVAPARLRLIEADTDDTWARDHGPLGVMGENGEMALLDYTFTGWGGKFPALRDDALTRALDRQGVWACPVVTKSLVLEGGGIETDGEGTLLATKECLLNPNRNPDHSQEEIEALLKAELGVSRILWLENGYLEGDDTDSHIDTLARFCSPDTIAYVRCDDETDPHYAALKAMEAELMAFRRLDGSPYRLVALPWPKAALDPDDGHRLPATYANFLIINEAVLVPTYADPADLAALNALAGAFPGRRVIPVECHSVIRQHGSLHCLTMQLPRGTLDTALFEEDA
ncbi:MULTISPECIES: agmatine/peptidylarginine deiminase [unclassified Halomonas]|uniref:agmatine deiminase family protein n=1 Tax=unclassified Halomonas TaxID=2609666 RepID=UPI00209F6CD2|nr:MULTISPECIES: agmatine deiminase family protein [unclassified Halomonas]MCP1314258.1 agmatine deiminase family protein [Halomonas sp. 707D7]MCP1327856.1 agmatine deiminase family protein [Halomonas sp. 707D4]